jgi:hypothetical protein
VPRGAPAGLGRGTYAGRPPVRKGSSYSVKVLYPKFEHLRAADVQRWWERNDPLRLATRWRIAVMSGVCPFVGQGAHHIATQFQIFRAEDLV